MKNFDFIRLANSRRLAKYLVAHGFIPVNIFEVDRRNRIKPGTYGYEKALYRKLVKEAEKFLEEEHEKPVRGLQWWLDQMNPFFKKHGK